MLRLLPILFVSCMCPICIPHSIDLLQFCFPIVSYLYRLIVRNRFIILELFDFALVQIWSEKFANVLTRCLAITGGLVGIMWASWLGPRLPWIRSLPLVLFAWAILPLPLTFLRYSCLITKSLIFGVIAKCIFVHIKGLCIWIFSIVINVYIMR